MAVESGVNEGYPRPLPVVANAGDAPSTMVCSMGSNVGPASLKFKYAITSGMAGITLSGSPPSGENAGISRLVSFVAKPVT